MTHKTSHLMACIGFVMIVIIWGVFMVWSVYPYKTAKINEQPYIVSEKVIKQGENLDYMIDACNYTKIMPTVKKQFVDGIVYSTPDSAVRLPMGCHKTSVAVKVPKGLPPGEYYLKVFVSYKMNPVRTINSEYVTEKFTIIK